MSSAIITLNRRKKFGNCKTIVYFLLRSCFLLTWSRSLKLTVPETFQFDAYQFESWCSRICNPYCPSMQAKVLGRYFSQNNHDEMSPIATFLNFHLASLIEALTGLTVLASTNLTETYPISTSPLMFLNVAVDSDWLISCKSRE